MARKYKQFEHLSAAEYRMATRNLRRAAKRADGEKVDSGQTPYTPGRHRQRMYGMTQEQFDALWASQDGHCLICKEKKDILCVDHCHGTQKVRGLLCRSCNWGLGYFKDDPARLQAAIEYLARNG